MTVKTRSSSLKKNEDDKSSSSSEESICEGCEDSDCEDCENIEEESEVSKECEGCDKSDCEDCAEYEELKDFIEDDLDEIEDVDIADNLKDFMNTKLDKDVKKILIQNMKIYLGNFDEEDEFGQGPDDFIEDPKKLLRSVTPFNRITAKDFVLNKFDENKSINNIQDLITILDHVDADIKQKELLNSLKELNNLVGMKNIKEQIVNQILFFIQDLYDPGMFLHTVITGSPGCGKTSVAHIMSKLYKSLGFLSNDKIVIVDRSDLVGMYLGHTAIKTKKALESALGGIILIDEAYSLGSSDNNTDSYSKECIDTINQFLSEHSEDLICIIAGYKDAIEECFFKHNSGLKRRFPWKFNIENYTCEELYDILLRQLGNWIFDVPKDLVISHIKKNMNSFSSNGGDTQILLDRCKVCHARRIFTITDKKSKTITKDDFVEGLKNFLLVKSSSEKLNNDSHTHMYI